MVSILFLISKSSSLFSTPLETIPSAPSIIVSPPFSCSTAFLVLWQGPSIFLYFHFLLFLLGDQSERQSPLDGKSFIIIIYFLRVFHISFSWWFLSGVWVTASLLKSPGLFSVLLVLLFTCTRIIGLVWFDFVSFLMAYQTFPKGISSKVKEITWLEFELAYYDIAVRHVIHYVTRSLQPYKCLKYSKVYSYVQSIRFRSE